MGSLRGEVNENNVVVKQQNEGFDDLSEAIIKHFDRIEARFAGNIKVESDQVTDNKVGDSIEED